MCGPVQPVALPVVVGQQQSRTPVRRQQREKANVCSKESGDWPRPYSQSVAESGPITQAPGSGSSCWAHCRLKQRAWAFGEVPSQAVRDQAQYICSPP